MTRASGRYSGQMAFIGVTVVLALVVVVLTTVGIRAYDEVSEQMTRYQAYRALQRDAGKADSLSAIYAGVLQDLEKIRHALPAENQASYVLNILVDQARNQNLSIAAITALDEVPFPNYKEIPFELNLSGDFQNLLQYLHALETQGMVLQVRKLAIASEAMNQAKIKSKLEISVFVP